jgi:hypothetical protein
MLQSFGNIYSIPKLSTVLANNNNIQIIPYQFANCKYLQNFSIYGNPQKTIRANIVTQGCEAIMKALRLKIIPENENQTISNQKVDMPPPAIVRGKDSLKEESYGNSLAQHTSTSSYGAMNRGYGREDAASTGIVSNRYVQPPQPMSNAVTTNFEPAVSYKSNSTSQATLSNDATALKINMLENEVESLEHSLNDSSTSEAKR